MGRKPKTKEAIRAQKEAEDICQKCLATLSEGRLLGASWSLFEAIEKILDPKQRRGQAGETVFKETAVIMLSFCDTNNIPPTEHLVNAVARLFHVKPDGVGDKYARVVFAAGHATIDEVPPSKLKNVGSKPIHLDTAKNLIKKPRFRKLVEGEKLAQTPTGRKLGKAVRNRAKNEVELYGVVKKAARDPDPVGSDAPERKLTGYVIPPLSKQREQINVSHRNARRARTKHKKKD